MTTPFHVSTPPYALQEPFQTHGANRARIIVLHDTEGGSPRSVVGTLRGQKPQLGIHWIVGQGGAVIRGSDSQRIVYHCGEYNDSAIGIEQCGYASQSHAKWMSYPWQLLNVAWIVAWEAQRHNVPIVKLPAREAQREGANGVCYHSDLGANGGGHHDPGAGYPVDHVLGMARSIQARGLGRLERVRATLHAHGAIG